MEIALRIFHVAVCFSHRDSDLNFLHFILLVGCWKGIIHVESITKVRPTRMDKVTFKFALLIN